MQIRRIVLFSHDGRRRSIKLRLGSLNIVTGDAMTGKSALLDIIEYCLGRSTFNAPAGPISERISWFGVLVQFEGRRVWIGRPAPSRGKATSQEAMLEVGTSTRVPLAKRLVVNSNVWEVRSLLNSLLGVQRFVVPGSFGAFGKDYSASVAHALLLSLQKQSEIANQEYLFHRQSEVEMAEALRNTLPYFLGAVPLDYAAKRGELTSVRREIRSLGSDLRSAEERSTRFDRELGSVFEEAVLLGMLRPDAPLGREEITRLLREFRSEMGVTAQVNRADTNQLERRELRRRRAELQAALVRLDDEAFALRQVTEAEEGFRGVVEEQTRRLQAAGVLPNRVANENECPVCFSELRGDRIHVSELLELQHRLLSDLPGLEVISTRNSDEQAQLEETIRTTRARLASLDDAEQALTRSRAIGDSSFALGRLSARIDQLVESPDIEVATLISRRDALLRQASALEEEVGEEAVADRLSSISNLLSSFMLTYRDDLQLEHSGPLRLDLKKLTVVVDSASGLVPLRRVGSGGNWIGYHLLSHLALHKIFMEAERPTPRFLFLDQPSQAYFPVDSSLSDVSSSDQEAVRRMFKVLNDFAQGSKGSFQLIVCDHAELAEGWFQRAVVERWRDGEKLVPADWPDRE